MVLHKLFMQSHRKKYQHDEICLNQMNIYETPYEMTDDGLFFFFFLNVLIHNYILYILTLLYHIWKCIVDNTFAYPFQVESKFNKQHIISFYLMVHFIFPFHC